jgi:PAS domain S-box-containing protein
MLLKKTYWIELKAGYHKNIIGSDMEKSAAVNMEHLRSIKLLTKRLLVGTLAVNIVVAGIICISLILSYQNFNNRAAVVTQNITQILEEELAGTISKVDLAIQSVTDEVERQLKSGGIQKSELNDFIIREHCRLPELLAFRATDMKGDAIYGPKAQPVKTTSLAHRDYFSYLRDNPNAGLVISKPLTGGISGERMIVLSRRINHPDGGFAGLVYAGVPIDYLTKTFSKVNIGTNGVITLRDSDFDIIARYPKHKTDGRNTQENAISAQLHAILKTGKSSETYMATSKVDSIERTFSLRTVSLSKPYYLIVGVATSDYLAPWRKEMYVMSAFMILFSVITGIFATKQIRLLTKQELQNKQILESGERFNQLAVQSRTFSWEVDYKGLYTFVSQVSEAVTGYRPDEIVGKKHFYDLHPEGGREEFSKAAFEVFEQKSAFQDLVNPVQAKDGSLIWVSTNGFPLLNADGTLSGYRCSNTDITDRKRLEEEKHTFEQQLQHAQKLESLGILSGGIAHDFNNILAIIVGYCGLTKMDYETAQKNIPEIEKAAERAAGLCRQMLAYAGKAQLKKTRINMVKKVDEIVGMLKATLPQNAVIKTGLSSEIPLIDGDVSQLRQVVMNLIINASEAIGTEQGEVNISLSRIKVIAGKAYEDYRGKPIPSGEYVCLEVTDNGCGMDDGTKWRIFEPFYTTKFTGRGLGMSAVLGIINSHGGVLQLFSKPGHGTTFKVYLPSPTGDTAGEEDQTQSTPLVPWQGNGAVLLVEDEDQVRFLAKSLLEMFGFTVLEAVNGKEALELYQKNAAEIRLVLTDIGMPVMDGYALIPALKKLDPELPIIISSGFGDTEVSSRIGSDNIAGLISKPYNPSQLREVLKSALEGTT